MVFEVSGVEAPLWLPPLIAFVLAFFSSTGGLSGAFILLPIQMSLFGFTSPAVTPTNHLYNIIAIPGGVYRYIREKRMLWPLAAILCAGLIPGVILGSWIRLRYLPDPKAFKLFVGCVLLFIGWRMFFQSALRRALEKTGLMKPAAPEPEPAAMTEVKVLEFSLRRFAFSFAGKEYNFPTVALYLPAIGVGVVSGAYGIGGGAIYIGLLVTFFPMPVYAFAGALLFGTLLSSLIGVAFFAAIAPYYGDADPAVAPDWTLGLLFGLGGLAGTYLGARLQRRFPQDVIKSIIGVAMLIVAARYIAGYLM